MLYIGLFAFIMICIGCNKIASIYFPKQYNMALFELALHFNYIYSQLEIAFYQATAMLFNRYPLVKTYFNGALLAYMDYKNADVNFIKDGMFIITVPFGKIEPFAIYPYDFYITRVFSLESTVNYNLLHFSMPSDYSCNPCGYKFIAVTVEIDKLKYVNLGFNKPRMEIELASKSESYYHVGNRINKYVISYLLKKQYDVSCSPSCLEYILHIIDHNAKNITLSQVDEIRFNSDGYEIKRCDESKLELLVDENTRIVSNFQIKMDSDGKRIISSLEIEDQEEEEENSKDSNYELIEEVEFTGDSETKEMIEVHELIQISSDNTKVDIINDIESVEEIPSIQDARNIQVPLVAPEKTVHNFEDIDLDLYLR